MLYKRKQNGNYYTNFTLYGKRIHRSTGTKDKSIAQEFEDKLKAAIHANAKLGEKPRYRWQDAVVKYVKHHAANRTIDRDQDYFDWLDPYLKDRFIDTYQDGITSEVIEQIKEAKLSEKVTNRTVNAVLEVVRKTLNYAKKLGMVDRVVEIEMLPKKKGRIRWETRENMDKLIEDLIAHKNFHTADMVDFTLETGLRSSNVTGLQKNQIDFERRTLTIYGDESKNEETFTIPLTNRAVVILRRNIHDDYDHIFRYNNKPIAKAGKRAFRAALKRCGIRNFTWHDLRHTWATWHIAAGTPLRILMELGGWKDIKSVMIYAHVNTDHLKEFADSLSETRVPKSATPLKANKK